MSNLNRTLSIFIIAAVLLCTFAGCGSGGTQHKASVFEATKAATQPLTEVTTAAETTEQTTAVPEATAAPTTEKITAKPTTVKATAALTTLVKTTVQAISETTAEATKRQLPTLPKIGGRDKEKKNAHFFDDVVFIGDSVSLGLKNYVTNQRNNGNECLGKAQFLVAGSMGFTNSLGAIGKKNTIHPKYQGKEVMVDDGVRMIGAKKAFIMLGLNDFCGYALESSMKNAKIFVTRIIDKNPGIKIYIQSVTPVISAKEHGNFTNDTINKFNSALRKLCSENGWVYVDVASVMKNEKGCFKDEYCSDKEAQGVHMTNAGYRAWIAYLNDKFC